MPAFYFPKLVVYQRAIEFAVAADEFSFRIPRNYEHLSMQLRRASLSVPLNVAEGSGSHTVRLRLKHYGIANGSAAKCASAFEFLIRRRLFTEEDLPLDLLNQVGALLTASRGRFRK